MRTSPRRALVAGTLVGGLLICLSATLGWACIGLSTLSSGSSAASPGQQVEVQGNGFASKGGDVSVRVDSSRGEVVAMVAARSDGTFQTSLTVPDMGPGQHVLVATQSSPTGQLIKTARLPLVVPGGPALGPLSGESDQLSPVTTPASSGPPVFLVGPLGLTALVLMLSLAARFRRSRSSTPRST